MISKYCALAALLCAALSIGIIIFVVIQRTIYSDQIEGVNANSEPLSDEMFDWKTDDFERSFTARFTVPTIIVICLCVLSVALSIASVALKYSV